VTLGLALLWPVGAIAATAGADSDRDKVTDGLEHRLEPLSSGAKLRLIVSLDRRATAGRIEQLEDEVGDLEVKKRFGVVDAVALTATKAQVRRLAREGVVTRVAEDKPVHAATTRFGSAGKLNDSAQSSFGVTEARLDQPLLDGNADGDPNAYSSEDLVAAVLDSGIDSTHVDLDENKVIGFARCLSPLPCTGLPAYDDEGHGTHVAGTIAGDGDGPSTAARGVAPGAALVGVKVLDHNGDGFTSDVVAGIEWVIANKDTYGIEALNISLGSEGCGDGLDADSQAVNQAYAAGLVVAVAAGNAGPSTCTIGSPGDAKDAITVAAMADLGANGFKQGDFSSRGPTLDGRVKPDISAPGVAVTSAARGTINGYATMNGTSMAAPFVTGVALLIEDADPSLLNDEVREAIRTTAVDWGPAGADIDYGAGRLDAYAAIAQADPTLTGGPQQPEHAFRAGSLSGTGATLEYTVDVASLSFPVAATLVDIPTACAGASNPDFDLKLIAPNGSTVATASSGDRQDELGYQPASTGVYRLRVFSFHDCGDFFVDVSGGDVSPQGSAGQGEPDPGPTSPPPENGSATTATPVLAPPVATAALVDAARLNARRAASSLRRSGLRRLLRRRSFSLRGVAPSAGRLELVVRARHRGRQRIVAKLTRLVASGGEPRLTVRLTAAGRRLFSRPLARRLSVRAAVSDSATGRRTLASRSVLVRR
jgi:serine protease AprX